MSKIKLEGIEYEKDSSELYDAVREIITDDFTTDEFDDMIDCEYGGTVKVGFIEVDTATAIRELDELAYEMAYDEELDNMTADALDDLEEFARTNNLDFEEMDE